MNKKINKINYEVRSGWSTSSSGNVIETYNVKAKNINNAVKQVKSRDINASDAKAVTNEGYSGEAMLILEKLRFDSMEYLLKDYVKEYGKPKTDECDELLDNNLEWITYYWDIRPYGVPN